MASSETEQGQAWILHKLMTIASDRGVAISKPMWIKDADDLRRGTVTLVFKTGGRRVVESFRQSDVEDVPGDSGVRNGMDNYLRSFVARISQPPKPQLGDS